jgi:hypothetical protein
VVAGGGTPLLDQLDQPHLPWRPGSARGRIRMTADFDAPLPAAVLDAFTGKAE